MNRRQFLTHSGVMLAGATQLSSLGRLAYAAPGGDYCPMVCILLAGGADSFNMLVPFDDDRYNEYAGVRSDLALPQEELLEVNFSGAGGARFGVHPGMGEVRDLFNSGDLAFIANIGPLAEPTSRTALDAGTAQLPLGLFSHSDQIAVWQTSAAGVRVNTGFAGRVADILEPRIASGPVSMNISMSGTSLFQTGEQVTGYVMDAAEGVRELAGYGDGSEPYAPVIDSLLALDFNDPFRQTYAQVLRDAIDSGAELSAALQGAPTFTTVFSETEFSTAMQQIANVISVRDALGVERQTFFVTVGGWDHHDEVLVNQANMLPGISQGLSEFHSALTELGVLDNVTTFTISDFGRTLTSNGRGSDHGWGGNLMVMGGSVNGGQIFGEYPELALDSELDLGRGVLLPTTSTDEFYADLALWFGVEPSELAMTLPNIDRFFDTGGGGTPLGIFA